MKKTAILFAFITGWIALTSLVSDPGQARQDYITKWKDEAIYQMVVHRIPASITLAQGILESRSGQSRLATEGNNHFGIKCHKDWDGPKIYEDDETKGECFRKYKNAHQSFEDHSEFLKRTRYEKLFKLKTDDYKGWAKGLKDCGYATNNKYDDLLIKIIEDCNLHEYDKLGMEYIRKGKTPERGEGGKKEGRKEDRQERKERKDNKKDGGTDLPEEITIHSNRQVQLSANRVKFVIAAAGDTQQSIAAELEMSPWQIRKYNDLAKGDVLKEGDVIYLQPKRNKGIGNSHTMVQGETLRDISQQYAVKLKSLRKINGLADGQEPAAGAVIRLK